MIERKRAWPDLSHLKLTPTIETLHLWTQVVGKVRLMLTPWENHGWHVPFYVSASGLVTGLVPVSGKAFTMEFDFVAEELVLLTTAGDDARLPLEPQSMSAFLAAVLALLGRVGLNCTIDPMPSEIAGAVRFDQDHAPRGFDAEVAMTYWRALVEVHRVFQLFRTRFTGKVSPIHLFWGAFDLAVTRFSGREAPPHPGGAPFMNDAIAREAYCREVSSAGFWPNLGDPEGPLFYSYAYPAPDRFADATVAPAAARWDAKLGEFVLPYAAVRGESDPDGALLQFLQSTYEAAADGADWNRRLLDREQGQLGVPPKHF